MPTNKILMIRPVNFSFNAETAVNNAFQVNDAQADTQTKAAAEFNNMVHTLRSNGIDVLVIDDTPSPHTPDSIFPNNWVSFHDDGTVVLYPMFAVNRRAERKPTVLQKLFSQFEHSKLVDLSRWEEKGLFLEGTGSMVLDRENKIAYACISPRTNLEVLQDYCAQMNYSAVAFHASDQQDQLIYHTNVMMCVADKYVVICLDSIRDSKEKENLLQSIQRTGKQVVPISLAQMNAFAGNMLQVKNAEGNPVLVMSQQAYDALTTDQVKTLAAFNPILSASLDTIEKNGGGSARCMMAEIYLPEKV
ncbi:MAG TPA: arginine deiminase-related protein [Flavihumibacter sp.]|nr:amidinotransferase [Bacteroidota bacterium]HOA39073.1 arginine deiminase-related protein [Flavihumibacter sp.]HPZ89627.1 arginine deiminase-related protein [Flavihumibacter sp.]